jgi:hypothetical protein
MSKSLEEMDATYTDAELVERARDILGEMCNGGQRWRMSIPVQASDSDMVIGEVIRRVARLSAENETLKAKLDRCAAIADEISAEFEGDMNLAAKIGTDAGAGHAIGARSMALRILAEIRASCSTTEDT